MTSASVILKSRNDAGYEVATFLLTFPRIILAEVNTHRAFSRNTSSSRAIPFKIMVEEVNKNPFIPIEFQKGHKGMQGNKYHSDSDRRKCEYQWLKARDKAVKQAQQLQELDVTKQLCNRLLEPFMWVTMVVTSSDDGLQNFFKLRCSYKDGKRTDFIQESESPAEVHIQQLANRMHRAYNSCNVNINYEHIPFDDDIKNSVVICARTSYTSSKLKLEGSEELYNKLLRDRHMSPFEHQLFSTNDDKYYYNIKGFKSLRYKIEQENYVAD